MIQVIPAISNASGLHLVSRNGFHTRACITLVVFPKVTKPQMWQHMDIGSFSSPIYYCHLHKDIIDIGFGVFNITIKIGIVFKDSCIQ